MVYLLTCIVPGKQFVQNARYAAHALPRMHAPAWWRSITRIEEPATTTAFKTKMATEEAQQIYAQRSSSRNFRMLGSRSAAVYGNSVVDVASRSLWKLLGRASATI